MHASLSDNIVMILSVIKPAHVKSDNRHIGRHYLSTVSAD